MEGSILKNRHAMGLEKWNLNLWKPLVGKLKKLFEEKFESDWEKKTGLPWKEWRTWGEWQKLENKKEEHDLEGGRNMTGFILVKRKGQILPGCAAQSEKGDHPGSKRLIGKLRKALEEGSNSDLNKKIGRPWHEWHRWD